MNYNVESIYHTARKHGIEKLYTWYRKVGGKRGLTVAQFCPGPPSRSIGPYLRTHNHIRKCIFEAQL